MGQSRKHMNARRVVKSLTENLETCGHGWTGLPAIETAFDPANTTEFYS